MDALLSLRMPSAPMNIREGFSSEEGQLRNTTDLGSTPHLLFKHSPPLGFSAHQEQTVTVQHFPGCAFRRAERSGVHLPLQLQLLLPSSRMLSYNLDAGCWCHTLGVMMLPCFCDCPLLSLLLHLPLLPSAVFFLLFLGFAIL